MFFKTYLDWLIATMDRVEMIHLLDMYQANPKVIWKSKDFEIIKFIQFMAKHNTKFMKSIDSHFEFSPNFFINFTK